MEASPPGWLVRFMVDKKVTKYKVVKHLKHLRKRILKFMWMKQNGKRKPAYRCFDYKAYFINKVYEQISTELLLNNSIIQQRM